MTELDTRIVAFLREVTRARRVSISDKTELTRDLGLDGADAAELLTLYAEEFGVDMSEFDFNIFFGPEVGPTPFNILRAIFGSRKSQPIPITVGDLILAAKARKWTLTH